MITCNSEGLLLKAMEAVSAASLKRLAIFHCLLRRAFKTPVKGPNLNVVRFVSFFFVSFLHFVTVFVIFYVCYLRTC